MLSSYGEKMRWERGWVSRTYQPFDQQKRRVEFNEFLTRIGRELARKIPTVSRIFETFLNKMYTTMPADLIIINELKEAFFP